MSVDIDEKCKYSLIFNSSGNSSDHSNNIYVYESDPTNNLKFKFKEVDYTCSIDEIGNIELKKQFLENPMNLPKNNINMLFLILLYAAIKNQIKDTNIQELKISFKKLIDFNKETDKKIYCYWKKVFNFFDKDLDKNLEILQKPDNYQFEISGKLTFKSDTFKNLTLDHPNKCSDNTHDKYKLKLSEESLKIELDNNNYYLIDKLAQPFKNKEFRFKESKSRISFISNKVVIDDYNITLNNHEISKNQDCDKLFIILLFLYLNHNKALSNHYNKFDNLSVLDEQCKNKWKIIFCRFGISNNDFDKLLKDINTGNIPPPPPPPTEFSFSIKPDLKFTKDNNYYILKDNNCSETTNNRLIVHGNDMKLDIPPPYNTISLIINKNLVENTDNIFYIKIGTTDYKLKIDNNIIYYSKDTTGSSILVEISGAIKEIDIEHKPHFYYLILLYIYLQNNKDELLKEYLKIFTDLDYNIHHIWKEIFCNFGIPNIKFKDLIINIFKFKIESFALNTIQVNNIIEIANNITCNKLQINNLYNMKLLSFTFIDNNIFNNQINIHNLDFFISIDLTYIYAGKVMYTRLNKDREFYLKCGDDNENIYTINTIAFNYHFQINLQGAGLRLINVLTTYNNPDNINNDKLRKQLYYGKYHINYKFYYKKDKDNESFENSENRKCDSTDASKQVFENVFNDNFIGYKYSDNVYVFPHINGNEYKIDASNYRFINITNDTDIIQFGFRTYIKSGLYGEGNAYAKDSTSIDIANETLYSDYAFLEHINGTAVIDQYSKYADINGNKYVLINSGYISEKLINELTENYIPDQQQPKIVYPPPPYSSSYPPSYSPQPFQQSFPPSYQLLYPASYSPQPFQQSYPNSPQPFQRQPYQPPSYPLYSIGGHPKDRYLYVYVLIILFNKLILSKEIFNNFFIDLNS